MKIHFGGYYCPSCTTKAIKMTEELFFARHETHMPKTCVGCKARMTDTPAYELLNPELTVELVGHGDNVPRTIQNLGMS